MIETLYNAAWRAVADRADGETAGAIAIPEQAAPGEADCSGGGDTSLAVLEHLDDALSAAMQHPLAGLARSFAEVRDHLTWSQNATYAADSRNAAFLNGYAFAMLSGPGAMIERRVPISGFILLAPGLHYPGHHHPAREIYLPLTPGATWRLGDGDWFDVAPGDLIFHDTWMIHATKTGAGPFLAFVAWLDEADRNVIKWADPD